MNEPLFERSTHDRKNPYVMVSREMAQDPTISPKAKGVLLYLLSLPPDWKIYHSQLQKALNVGEDYINSAMQELMDAGYAERSRETVKGLFQPYRYIIREFKKCLPDRENRPGFSGPENPGIQNKHATHTKETTTKERPPLPAAAVVSLDKKKEAEKPKESKVMPKFLESLDIPILDKAYLVDNYSPEVIKNAVDWAMHPTTKIKTTLIQAIKWACVNKPEVPKKTEDCRKENKNVAVEISKNVRLPTYVNLEILHNHAEVVYLQGQKSPTIIAYDEKGFKAQLVNALQKAGCILPRVAFG